MTILEREARKTAIQERIPEMERRAITASLRELHRTITELDNLRLEMYRLTAGGRR